MDGLIELIKSIMALAFAFSVSAIFWIGPALFVIWLIRNANAAPRNKTPRTPTTLGERGETAVKRVIGETIESQQYVINDLIIANGGYTSQIDHIVINPRGIFVIETKNYSGRIYGTEDQQNWTQVLAYGEEKHKIYNPLKQNATHIYNVKRIVGNLPIHSLVVFVQGNIEYIKANNVIPLWALRSALESGEMVLSIEQMKSAYNALISNKADITTEEHIRNVERFRH